VVALAFAALLLTSCSAGEVRTGAKAAGEAARAGEDAAKGAGDAARAGGEAAGTTARLARQAAAARAATALASSAQAGAVRDGRAQNDGAVAEEVERLLAADRSESEDVRKDAEDACEVKGLVDMSQEDDIDSAAQKIVVDKGKRGTAKLRVEELADELRQADNAGDMAKVAADALCEAVDDTST
jgi:hypothetical protein